MSNTSFKDFKTQNIVGSCESSLSLHVLRAASCVSVCAGNCSMFRGRTKGIFRFGDVFGF